MTTGFVAPHASRIELGALLLSLRLWQARGGTIGGQAARGHGRLSLSLVGDVDQTCVDEYIAYAASMRDDAVAWLQECFAANKKKKVKA